MTDRNTRDDNENSSGLEHALLESLFYNEMVMVDESISSDFMAYLSSSTEGATEATPDAGAIAERAMLRDFGVAPSAMTTTTTSAHATTQNPVTQELVGQVHSDQNLSLQPTNSEDTLSNEPSGQGQTSQLVSQFATLASRLGVSLPPDVLASLSKHSPDSPHGGTSSLQGGLNSLSGVLQEQNVDNVVEDEPPPAAELDAGESDHETSGNRKRPHQNLETSSKAPLYSKRRKKPRLSDCENKLAALKAENEMLKMHLDTVTNRSQKIVQERKQQEEEMKRLVKEDAGPEKLDPLLNKFREMYSDYGKTRDQELLFHLQQLQRLVVPTNFTKMGLWTLGQNDRFYTDLKRNPIAGILRKELDVTPQQGRKILEQRQKIRNLSDNLKECLRLLAKLKSICEHKQKVFSDRMSKCQEILTPMQVVKLLLWVDEHSDVLASTCPGWRSETIVTTTASTNQKE